MALTAALLSAVAGAALGALATRRASRTSSPRPSSPPGRWSSRPDLDPPGPVDPPDPIGPVLESLRQLVGAERLVLWTVHRDDDRLDPIASTGAPPRPLVAAGDPLSWCAEQRQPMRVDPAPAWAVGDVLAIPVRSPGTPRVLTVEGDGIDASVEAPVATLLEAVLDLHDRRLGTVADLDRFERILAFLRDLPRSGEPGAFPAALASTAARVARCDGALVARYADLEGPGAGEEATLAGGVRDGVVLARAGESGGPQPGTVLDRDEGDLAMAARAGATIRRDAGVGAGWLTGAAEPWTRRPRFSASIPLLDPDGRCSGVLALWGDEPVDPGAVELFEALGPLLAIQLGHSLDLARYRDRVERDALTGLADRAALDDRLVLETRRFHRYRRPLALLLLDLDHFKDINDTFGHQAGDEVLRRLADVLWANTREPDLAARYGGEEMVVVLPGAMLRHAADVAERIRGAVESAVFVHEGTELRVTVSIGVSSCPESAADPRELVSTADAALYEAKRAGRNRVVTRPPAPARG